MSAIITHTTYTTTDGKQFGTDRESAEIHQDRLNRIAQFCEGTGVPEGRARAAKSATIMAFLEYEAGVEVSDDGQEECE